MSDALANLARPDPVGYSPRSSAAAPQASAAQRSHRYTIEPGQTRVFMCGWGYGPIAYEHSLRVGRRELRSSRGDQDLPEQSSTAIRPQGHCEGRRRRPLPGNRQPGRGDDHLPGPVAGAGRANRWPLRDRTLAAPSFFVWALPGICPGEGYRWIGVPLALAAILLGLRARREGIGRGRATAAIVLAGICIAQMAVWTAVSVADAKTAKGHHRAVPRLLIARKSGGKLFPGCDLQLRVGVAEVLLDRLSGDEQLLGDLHIAEAVAASLPSAARWR